MFTYFIRQVGSNYVKIGRAEDPILRLKGLQGSNPNALELIGVIQGDKERELHTRFAMVRMHGEWFRSEGTLEGYLEANASALADCLAAHITHKQKLKQLARESRRGKPRPRFYHPNQPPTRAALVRAGFLKKNQKFGEIRGVLFSARANA